MSGGILFLIIVVLVLVGVTILVYFLQDNFIFDAEKLDANHEFDFPGLFEELNLKTEDGERINGVLFNVKQPKGLVFFMHNHAGNIEHWSRMAFYLNQFNLDVFIMDYRSYGKSTGKFDERKVYKDVSNFYSLMKQRYDENKITLYGRGLGAGFVSFLASTQNPKQLILESPLFNLKHTTEKYFPFMPFMKYVPKYKFDTGSHLVKVKKPVTIFHGKMNNLVHYSNSLKLKEINKEHVKLILIPDGDHYNLLNHQTYLKEMSSNLGR